MAMTRLGYAEFRYADQRLPGSECMFLTPAERIADYVARGWWDDITVDDLFQRTARACGDTLALVDPLNREQLDGRAPEHLTWPQLRDRVERLAGVMLAAGLRKDDVVCVQLPNTGDAVVVFLACARLGLIVSPVVMQYREHELRYILDLIDPVAFITIPTFAGHSHGAMAEQLALEHSRMRVLLFDGGGQGDLHSLLEARADPAVAAYVADHPTRAGEVLTICWTSGTEATPKGVPRDHNHWILNARIIAESTGMQHGDTLLDPFPLVNIASIGGLVLPWLWVAGRLVLHHPFDLGVFLRQIAAERVTYTIAPPAVLTMLLNQPALAANADLTSLRAIGSGSAPLSPWLIKSWLETHGIQVCNIFGSNEGTSLISSAVDVPDTTERARYFPRWGAMGVHWDGITSRVIRTRLVDPESEEEIVAPGRPGELRIAGAMAFSGYWRSPDMNRAAFDEQGYFRTGDLFEIAGTGTLSRFYRFVGRFKEIIVRGGVNISPAELDDLLVGLPLLKEAATVGVPDQLLGERVAVAVVAKDGATPTLDDITAWLERSSVAIFKRPERLVIVDALPRNAMNKVVRSTLRETVMRQLGMT
jgi:cyclohexanecarboxylate-CoA ligase